MSKVNKELFQLGTSGRVQINKSGEIFVDGKLLALVDTFYLDEDERDFFESQSLVLGAYDSSGDNLSYSVRVCTDVVGQPVVHCKGDDAEEEAVDGDELHVSIQAFWRKNKEDLPVLIAKRQAQYDKFPCPEDALLLHWLKKRLEDV